MKVAVSLTAMAVLGTLMAPANSQDKPGREVATSASPGTATVKEVIRATGVVEAIDLEKRHVVIKDSHGTVIPLDYGPEVRNLEQLKVGDRATVRYASALTLTLMKDGKELRSKIESTSDRRAAAGNRPGGVVGQKVEVTADVIAINKKTHIITLRGTQYAVDVQVPDPDQLKMIKVGDQVHAVYTEAVALSVEPAKK